MYDNCHMHVCAAGSDLRSYCFMAFLSCSVGLCAMLKGRSNLAVISEIQM